MSEPHAEETTLVQRLKSGLAQGHHEDVEQLLRLHPELQSRHFCIQVALYDVDRVKCALEQDPALAITPDGPRRPILHLAFSKWIKAHPEREADMLAVAQVLVDHGADVNDGFPHMPGSDHLLSALSALSALYGAIGHADNMALGRWLLQHGANPDDGESLYHATELGHHEGLRLLLDAGADPTGTNALLRAMDFHDHDAVQMLLGAGARADDFNAAEVGGESPWVVPALHQAARRGSDARMVGLLLKGGARCDQTYQGASAYAYGRVHGNMDVVRAVEAAGRATPLNPEEMLLAQAAEGRDTPGAFVDPNKLAPAYANIIREILHLSGKLEHVRRLVALGLPYDAPDAEGLTPVQVAGWEGLPEVLEYFVSLKLDLEHVNGYGGTLLTTILHGSENNPARKDRDYIACLRAVLHLGVALPREAMETAAVKEVRAFLEDWAEAKPSQLV